MQDSKTVPGIAPEALISVFSGSARGEILMVHAAAIYITLQDTVYLFSPERYGVTPIGICTPDFARLAALFRPMLGQSIELRNGTLYGPGGRLPLLLSGYEEVRLCCHPDAEACLRTAERLCSCGKKDGLSALAAPLLLHQPLRGTELQARALCALQMLLDGMLWENQEQISDGACKLLGLGVGLTPSGDDVLTGLIYGLQRSAARRKKTMLWLTDAVRKHAPQRTNRVSNAYLQAICAGMPFERMQQAWLGLDRRFPAAEEGLLEIGSNSGSEMLLGLLLAAGCAKGLKAAD